MPLKSILSKKTLVILGLNSGTSADGLDMACIQVTRTKRRPKIKFLTSSEKPYPSALQDLVLKIADSETVDLNALIHLENLLGQFYGQAAREYIRELAKARISVDVVASHGQTVRHLPERVRVGRFSVNGTLQLGSLDQIAAITGRIVIGDFRQADIACGGEGAPITTGAMHRLFASYEEARLIVNIGGMANFFFLPAQKSGLPAIAADCGPGNSLCDTLASVLFGEKFDRNGERAAKGTISQRLLCLLMSDPFFTGGRVSTGRETFGREMVQKMMAFRKRSRLSGEDLLATAVELTAAAITRKVQPLVGANKDLSKLYLTGGGRRNSFLVKRLKTLLPEVQIRPGDELGINADFIEAAAYAVMSEACLRAEPLNAMSGGNNKGADCIMGRIAQPPANVPKMTDSAGKSRQ